MISKLFSEFSEFEIFFWSNGTFSQMGPNANSTNATPFSFLCQNLGWSNYLESRPQQWRYQQPTAQPAWHNIGQVVFTPRTSVTAPTLMGPFEHGWITRGERRRETPGNLQMINKYGSVSLTVCTDGEICGPGGLLYGLKMKWSQKETYVGQGAM